MYDGEGIDLKVFHCEGCNACHAGGVENFFHCETCILCFPIETKESHRCEIKNNLEGECSICLKSMIDSNLQVVTLDACSHAFHNVCLDEYIHMEIKAQ